jgi:hypothetical protein
MILGLNTILEHQKNYLKKGSERTVTVLPVKARRAVKGSARGGWPAAVEAAAKERRTAPRREALQLQTAQPPRHSPRRCALRARMEDTTQAPCVVGPGVRASTLE